MGPVARDARGTLRGAEAVIYKDLTATLLAQELGAHALLLLTDVAAVVDNFGTGDATPIDRASPEALRRLTSPGSMGPKVDAACRFVERGGAMAAIGSLTDALGLLAGSAGTIVTATGTYPSMSTMVQ